MSLGTVADMLYRVATSGALEFGNYRITIITELCTDGKKCNQGVIFDNFSIVIHTNRTTIEKLLMSIKKLIKKG